MVTFFGGVGSDCLWRFEGGDHHSVTAKPTIKTTFPEVTKKSGNPHIACGFFLYLKQATLPDPYILAGPESQMCWMDTLP